MKNDLLYRCIVDEVLGSCYASIGDHHLAHLAMVPIRWFPDFIQMIFGEDDGISAFIGINEELGICMLSDRQIVI